MTIKVIGEQPKIEMEKPRKLHWWAWFSDENERDGSYHNTITSEAAAVAHFEDNARRVHIGDADGDGATVYVHEQITEWKTGPLLTVRVSTKARGEIIE